MTGAETLAGCFRPVGRMLAALGDSVVFTKSIGQDRGISDLGLAFTGS